MDNELFDFFDFGETRDTMDLIFTELENFKSKLIAVTRLLPFIMNKPLCTGQIIKKDFIHQLLYR